MGESEDGGPAFPIQGYTADASGALAGTTVEATGMSLRDYFAAHAPADVMGDISSNEAAAAILGMAALDYNAGNAGGELWRKVRAILIYQYADDMIEARAKSQS